MHTKLCKFYGCDVPAVSAVHTFCAGHDRRWNESPEHRVFERTSMPLGALTLRHMVSCLTSFVNRVTLEARNAQTHEGH